MSNKYRTNQVRIIAGKWRSRKIHFPAIEGLRPTADRMRETLFNWLSPQIQGQSCLDLFAGSGALGFEALSRGAAYVRMVDCRVEVIRQLQATAKRLQTAALDMVQGVVPPCLAVTPDQTFDVVFLDPPFKRQLITTVAMCLEDQAYLAENARIYIETELTLSQFCLPKHWEMLYNKRSSGVRYYLFQRR